MKVFHLALCAPLLTAAAQPAPEAAVSPIRVNQIGLLADGDKRAIVPNPARSPLQWQLIDQRGEVFASGRTRVFGHDRWSGEHLHHVDFSGFGSTGDG